MFGPFACYFTQEADIRAVIQPLHTLSSGKCFLGNQGGPERPWSTTQHHGPAGAPGQVLVYLDSAWSTSCNHTRELADQDGSRWTRGTRGTMELSVGPGALWSCFYILLITKGQFHSSVWKGLHESIDQLHHSLCLGSLWHPSRQQSPCPYTPHSLFKLLKYRDWVTHSSTQPLSHTLASLFEYNTKDWLHTSLKLWECNYSESFPAKWPYQSRRRCNYGQREVSTVFGMR